MNSFADVAELNFGFSKEISYMFYDMVKKDFKEVQNILILEQLSALEKKLKFSNER